MKKTDTDFEELETSPEAKTLGLRRINRAERPPIPKFTSLRDCKSRITMYVDADIIEYFKQEAEEKDAGYQTLINKVLREFVNERQEISTKESFKRELLKDEEFLRELKEALV